MKKEMWCLAMGFHFLPVGLQTIHSDDCGLEKPLYSLLFDFYNGRREKNISDLLVGQSGAVIHINREEKINKIANVFSS